MLGRADQGFLGKLPRMLGEISISWKKKIDGDFLIHTPDVLNNLIKNNQGMADRLCRLPEELQEKIYLEKNRLLFLEGFKAAQFAANSPKAKSLENNLPFYKKILREKPHKGRWNSMVRIYPLPPPIYPDSARLASGLPLPWGPRPGSLRWREMVRYAQYRTSPYTEMVELLVAERNDYVHIKPCMNHSTEQLRWSCEQNGVGYAQSWNKKKLLQKLLKL